MRRRRKAAANNPHAVRHIPGIFLSTSLCHPICNRIRSNTIPRALATVSRACRARRNLCAVLVTVKFKLKLQPKFIGKFIFIQKANDRSLNFSYQTVMHRRASDWVKEVALIVLKPIINSVTIATPVRDTVRAIAEERSPALVWPISAAIWSRHSPESFIQAPMWMCAL